MVRWQISSLDAVSNLAFFAKLLERLIKQFQDAVNVISAIRFISLGIVEDVARQLQDIRSCCIFKCAGGPRVVRRIEEHMPHGILLLHALVKIGQAA